MNSFLLFNSLVITSTLAQGCGNDVLVDDFSTTQNKFFDGANRIINKLGGDYGTDNATTFAIDTNARTITVIPQANENVFFYAKYDEQACFDLTKYYAFQFDLLAPADATATFTLTQKTADCTERGPFDSTYVPLSKYYTTPGQKQTIVMPFQDFTGLASGNGTFDMLHLKDWTFVDMKPLGQPFIMSNMMLIGGPPGCNGTAPVTNGTTGTTANTATNGTTGTNGTNGTTVTGVRPIGSSNHGERTVLSIAMLMICLLFI